MFGFAVLSVFFNLVLGLLLLSGLILVINLVVYRSLKLRDKNPWTCFGAICGTFVATGILGTLWNWIPGASAWKIWYEQFIHMPVYGALLGGYLGSLIKVQVWTKGSPILRMVRIGVAVAIAIAAFYSYLYTGAISYGVDD